MIKQFMFIFLIAVLLCAITIAQEKPKKEEKVSRDTTEIVSDHTTKVTEDIASEIPWNKVCPVKGNPIEDDTPTVDYDGKSYGFCCPGCDVKFAKNPEKYSKNLNEDGTKYIGR